jgi:4-hydroxybenzoate polyprenyltransferase
MGWAAARGALPPAPIILYLAGIAWTLGYDTIYAHQDKEDDALIGVKSTARLFAEATPRWLKRFYAAALGGIALAGIAAGLGWLYLLLLFPAAAHLGWQAATLNLTQPADCLAKFRSSRDLGLLVLGAIVIARVAG